MRNLFAVAALALGLMALALSPAQARPRDEVMSGAYRCAAIGDSRLWLECYYGAAQPVRAALGLKPAPAQQQALVAAPPPSPAGASAIAVRDSVMAGAFRCSGLAEDRPWLDCYYAAAQPMRASLGLSPGPRPAAPAIAPPPPADRFGLPAPAPQAIPGNGRQIWSPMASYNFSKMGYFTVTLANGEVWRQVDGDTDFAHWNGAPSRYLVHITHGFLRSFNLQVKGEPGLYKVLRVQ